MPSNPDRTREILAILEEHGSQTSEGVAYHAGLAVETVVPALNALARTGKVVSDRKVQDSTPRGDLRTPPGQHVFWQLPAPSLVAEVIWHFEDADCEHEVPERSTVLIGTYRTEGGEVTIRGKRCKKCKGLLY